MTKIQDVTGTAFIVAEYRAEENAEAHPLYRDPIVSLFLNERTRAAAERIAAGFPPARQGVKLRTRYYDDHLDAQLGNGCRQVVILGAGLDTRGVRKQAPGVTYFEIDDADTISFKQARLAEAGIEAPIVFIPGNYVSDGLLRLLDENGFDFDLPTYVIWGGNTMYLNRPAVLEVLSDLRGSVGKFAISFDYLTEAVIDYATGDAPTSAFVRRFAEMGAPWSFGIDDLEALAVDAGLVVIDKIKTADLYRTFWPSLPLDSIWYDNYSLCTLAAGEGITL
ncbi:MAG TPA: SAM-dependent methyltransferase [Methyloceanibacter sp.]|nr:SAM-dependent methyltransferase [Methyloceanibacter sp.]